jgi:hypothetical protein
MVKLRSTSPPNMTFGRDLVGPWLASWNEFLQRLASVQLTDGSDEFRWDTKNFIFSVGFMYEALIEPIQPVSNNKFIWNEDAIENKGFRLVSSSRCYSY